MSEFLTMFKRRRKESLTLALLIFLLGASMAYLLPASYRSTATILIEDNQPELNAIGNGLGGYADRRIKLISKRVLSSESLSRLARKLSLFPESEFNADGKLSATALSALRKQINIDLIKVKGVDPKTRFPVESAIAFDLSFTAETPEKAQKVTQQLAELFLEKNQRGTSGSNVTDEFLEKRLAELKARVDATEEKLKEFKAGAVYSLPEMKEANLRILEKTESELSDARLQLRGLKEEKVYLESELLRLKPYAVAYDADGNRILGPEDQLKALLTELAAKRAKYSPLHPDILKLEGEIANLRSVVRGDSPATAALNAELEQLLAERARMSQSYSAAHPSVKSIEQKIAAIRNALEVEREKLPIFTNTEKHNNADNPAYISTAAKLKTVNLEIGEQQARIRKLEQKYRTYEKRVETSPTIEREYNELLRQHEQALTEYNTLSQKTFSAGLSGSLERTNQQQELVLLEPADLPEAPYKPNRKLLLALSLFLGALGAIAMTLIREQMDNRIWTSRQVEEMMGSSPLTTIPEFKVNRPIHLVFLSDVLKNSKKNNNRTKGEPTHA